MGKAIVRLSSDLVENFLQFPDRWKIESAAFENGNLGKCVLLTVEGGSRLNSSGSTIPEMVGLFRSKSIEGKDGRWIQGEWELRK